MVKFDLSATLILREEKQVVVSNLVAAGLLLQEEEMTLYLRGESDRMMQTLSDVDRDHIWFSGCPGIGKSTMLFGYLNLPDVSSNGFLWIHCLDTKFDIAQKKEVVYHSAPSYFKKEKS